MKKRVMLGDLREEVCEANRALARAGLVTLTWGNVSGIDRKHRLVAIKPSGIPYSDLKPEHLVIVDLHGKVVDGKLRPSVDTPTHVILYREFPEIGGVTHTHSANATAFAQACRDIPCLGTTHADNFSGTVPLVRALTPREVEEDYVLYTGKVIVEYFRRMGLGPLDMPAALTAHHGPFTWGKDAMDSVRHSIALEEIAKIAIATMAISPGIAPIPEYIRRKHYTRKHGPKATYGQGG